MKPEILIPIIIGGVLLVGIIAFLLIYFLTRKERNKVSSDDWLIALGGKENIDDVSGVGSRVTLVLRDKEIIDRERLKTLGVSSVLTMANKIILVIEDRAVSVADAIRESLD